MKLRASFVGGVLFLLGCSGGAESPAPVVDPAPSPAVPEPPPIAPTAVPEPEPAAIAAPAVPAIAPLDPSACAEVAYQDLTGEPSRFQFELPAAGRTSIEGLIATEMGDDHESVDCAVRVSTRGLISATCASIDGDGIRVYTAGLTYVPEGEGFTRMRLFGEGRDGESLFLVARARFEANERATGVDEADVREAAEALFAGGMLAIDRRGLLFFADGTDPTVVVPWTELTPHLRDGSPIARWGATCGVPLDE